MAHQLSTLSFQQASALSSAYELIKLNTLSMSTTLAERIREAMEGAKLIPADLARATNVTTGGVSQWLDGSTKSLKAATAAAIEKATGYSADWIVTGKGPKHRLHLASSSAHHASEPESPVYAGKPKHRNRIPVVGTARMGDEGYYEEMAYPAGHGDGAVEGYSSDPNAYALRVRGDSMHPAIRDGQFVVIEPNATCQAGEFVVLALVDGQKMVKELIFQRADTVTVVSVNNGARATFERAQIQYMHPVAAVIAASRWKPD